jgi:hypothetical protein
MLRYLLSKQSHGCVVLIQIISSERLSYNKYQSNMYYKAPSFCMSIASQFEERRG